MSNFPQTAQVSGQPGSIRMPEAMPVPPVGGQNPDYGVSPGGFFVPELSARPHDGGSGFPQPGIGGFGGPAVQAANANALPPNPVVPPATASQKTSKPQAPAKPNPMPPSQTSNRPAAPPSGRPPNADYLHGRPNIDARLQKKPPQQEEDVGCCGCVLM